MILLGHNQDFMLKHPGRLTDGTYKSPMKRKENDLNQTSMVMFQPFIFQGETNIFILRFLAPPFFWNPKNCPWLFNVPARLGRGIAAALLKGVHQHVPRVVRSQGEKTIHQTGDFFEKKKPSPEKRKFIAEIQIVLMCVVMCLSCVVLDRDGISWY